MSKSLGTSTSLPTRPRFTVTVSRPPDFDAWWDESLAVLAAQPLRTEMRRLDAGSHDGVDLFDVAFGSLGDLTIRASYARPATVDRGMRLPGLLLGTGYAGEPLMPQTWARRGYATLSIATRGKLRSNARCNPGFPGLLVHDILDRSTYVYRGIYLDMVRGLEVLRSFDEVDLTRIGIQGTSQAGAQALVVAALRPEQVKCLAVGAPFMTGILQSTAATWSHPYRELRAYLAAFPEREAEVREALPYFDTLNFAPRIEAPVLLHLGLEDDVCAPEATLLLAQRLPHLAELHTFLGAGHEGGLRRISPRIQSFLSDRLTPITAVTQPHSKAVGTVADAGRPPDFEIYWKNVDREVSSTAPHLESVVCRRWSTTRFTVHRFRMTSIGSARVQGYLSVPTGDGTHPGLLLLPPYGSVYGPPPVAYACRFVVLTLGHRGQREADESVPGAFPGLFTQGIKHPTGFVYRGIVADCLQAADLLFGHEQVDPGRIGVIGNDLAAITAARRPAFTALQFSPGHLYDSMRARQRAHEYPLEELTDLLYVSPELGGDVARTLAYFNVRHHAPSIRCATLVKVPARDRSFYDALSAALNCEHRACELRGEDANERRFADRWLSEQLKVPTIEIYLECPSGLDAAVEGGWSGEGVAWHCL